MNLSILRNLVGTNLIAICVFSLFGIVLAYSTFSSAREWSTLYYLRRNGQLIDAKIKKLGTHNTGGGLLYFIEYEYDVESILYKSKQRISWKHYHQFQQQDYVTVRFAPTRRHWSRLAKSDFDNTYRNLSSYAAFMGCVLFAPFIVVWGASLIGTYWYLTGMPTKEKKKRSEA